MFFEQRLIGAMRNFGYVIGDPATKVAAVIDPSFDARVLQKAAAENGYTIELIFNTHHHPDHIYDNGRLANETGAKIAAHRLSNVTKDVVLEDGQIVGVGELKVKVVHTPGHSPDSCCYIVAGRVFTGDCLFVGDCGGVDLPGSSVEHRRSARRSGRTTRCSPGPWRSSSGSWRRPNRSGCPRRSPRVSLSACVSSVPSSLRPSRTCDLSRSSRDTSC
ncbi:MAG: MBL fold metallo-hydrolase [Methanobacteriota archaeon]|nr:MAG: MBL fold metallo-hydrolase [Euryarchaeota archaeon]